MTESSHASLTSTREGAVGWITFSNPQKHNAVTASMWRAIPRTLEELQSNGDVRVLVLRGAGDRAFVSGADISEFGENRATPDAIAQYEHVAAEALEAIAGFGRPTIAMINGYCLGGGVALAACCDLRVASDDARLGIPAAKLGIGYGASGIWRLCGLIGMSNTKQILFTGQQLTAPEALRMGLLNRIEAKDSLLAATSSLAETIAANAPLTIAAAKKCANEFAKSDAARDLEGCEAAIQRCVESKDYHEGRTAFMEKRRPQFQGH